MHFSVSSKMKMRLKCASGLRIVSIVSCLRFLSISFQSRSCYFYAVAFPLTIVSWMCRKKSEQFFISQWFASLRCYVEWAKREAMKSKCFFYFCIQVRVRNIAKYKTKLKWNCKMALQCRAFFLSAFSLFFLVSLEFFFSCCWLISVGQTKRRRWNKSTKMVVIANRRESPLNRYSKSARK